MVKSPQESGSMTAADRTATVECTAGVRVGEPAIVSGPDFGRTGLV